MSTSLITPSNLNTGNLILEQHRQSLARASRLALVPTCNPLDAAPLSKSALRRGLLRVPIQAAVNGDNPLIQSTSGQILIYEMFIWNASAAAVNINFYQGPSATGILLLPIPNFPATTGLLFGFNGNWEMPHFEVDSGLQFIMKLSTAGPVTGFIRYKIANGTE